MVCVDFKPELALERTARAVDPVCGMTTSTAHAVRREFDGQTHFFCSESCARKFECSPGAYDASSRVERPAPPASPK